MSVIFQTLKKLRNAPFENHQKGFLSKKPRLYVFRKSIISAATLVLVILGFAAMYGTRFLDHYLTKRPTTQQTTSVHAKASGWRAQYIAPTQNEPGERFSTALASVSPEKEASGANALEKDNAFSTQRAPANEVADTLLGAENISGKTQAPKLENEQRVDEEKNKLARDNHGHHIRVQQCGEITSLVAQLEKLLVAGEFTRSKELIDRLTVLKGEEDSYVLKLRSYWHMRQGEFSEAEPLLAMVLERNQEDLEAGVNMAIVEINADKVPAARNRLIHLKTIYDADTVIPDLLRQIEKQP